MVQQAATLNTGDVIGERYEVVEVIGRGGMGTVYLAEDLSLNGKHRAIKETILKKEFYQQFIDEANLLIELDHPYLPKIYDYFPPTDDGLGYIVMDYIAGKTLEQLFKESGRALSYQQVTSYALQLCDVFGYLHSMKPNPIIYRDLKPSNIMIDEQDNVRLIDFGIARKFKAGQDSDTVALGTEKFAAPEQFHGTQTDQRTDIFSLGATMFYLLSSGRFVYTEQRKLHEVNEDVPVALSAIVSKMCSLNQDQRYANMGEVKKALQSIEQSGPVLTQLVSRIKGKTGLAVVGVVLAVLVGGGYVVLNLNEGASGSETMQVASQVDSLVSYQSPVFAYRETVMVPAVNEMESVTQFSWKIRDKDGVLVDELTSEIGSMEGQVKVEFADAGDYTIELMDGNEELLSVTKMNVLPPPKVWFTPIVTKGEQLVSNQTVEFRGMKDEAFQPTTWFWGYKQLFDQQGVKVDEELRVLDGNHYLTYRFMEAGVYELHVQAQDDQEVVSDSYIGPLYIYNRPDLAVENVAVGAGQVSFNYTGATDNLHFEEDFSKATVSSMEWTVVDENDEVLDEGDISISEPSGHMSLEVMADGVRLNVSLLDSAGARSNWVEVPLR